jgi:hypothetical protein
MRDHNSDAGASRERGSLPVIAGLVPAISMIVAWHRQIDRDDRDKPGHDKIIRSLSQGERQHAAV